MAECNVSIDKKNLPGVKEVCRDFAVLEDHCLAYTLQEQERQTAQPGGRSRPKNFESHLASNVNKSKLVQKDLQVAKKLQEEEDQWAKVQCQKQHNDLERQDNEIAKEIQEQLVRQAEQQRQQEEKDALESNFEEEYFEDHGGGGIQPVCARCVRLKR
ncbi:unnamed protein product [Tetraodon nigroviridis]|uniref:(spotted green pufferfish) hypothetical protein n=1 Tax=Tetraodon nigroviridis TaxID=99883 RepID=Q4RU75_TETNG|nr:unnamed protein product [Tetraodon nigroviridis]